MRMVDPRTYRATTEAWLGQLLLPLAFFIVLTITAINLSGLDPRVAGIGLLMLMLIAALDYLLPMLRNYLYLDHQAIEGSLNGRHLYINWYEVLAAWLTERRGQTYLCLGTKTGTVIVSLRFMDASAIWERVRALVPPAALEECAMRGLPEFQAWAAERDSLAQDCETRPVADHWLIQLIGWAGLTFFLFGGIVQAGQGHIVMAALFFLLVVGSIYLLLNWGITEFSSQGIERSVLLGNSAIAWKDVRWIEMDPLDSVMVLVGDDTQLVIPGPKIWSGLGRKAALAMLLTQAEHRRIPIRRTKLAWLRISRRVSLKK